MAYQQASKDFCGSLVTFFRDTVFLLFIFSYIWYYSELIFLSKYKEGTNMQNTQAHALRIEAFNATV